MKCKMNGTEVFKPCIASCPLFGDCVVEYENELHSHKPTNTNHMKKPTKEIKAVIAWMQNQMYDERTEWTYGNEHDLMYGACSLLSSLIQEEE